MKMVIAITGGGTEFIGDWLRQGTNNGQLMEAIVPYSEKALHGFLDYKPEKCCSEDTARQMAMEAYERARGYDKEDVVGVGVTCVLAKRGPERANRQHKMFMAIHSCDKTKSIYVPIARAERTTQEMRVAAIVHDALRGIPIWEPSVQQDFRKTSHKIYELYRGDVSYVATPGMPTSNLCIYPGSFNPLHEGHRNVMVYLKDRFPVVKYELCIQAWDKPLLDFVTLGERLHELGPENTIVSRATSFRDKGWVFPHSTFAIGSDTYNRLANSLNADDLAMFEASGTRFIVFHRDQFPIQTCDELNHFCSFADFGPMDISSTNIRKERSDDVRNRPTDRPADLDEWFRAPDPV